jgi:hypothetical protein
LCTTRTRAFDLIDLIEQEDAVCLLMEYAGALPGIGSLRIERRLWIARKAPEIRVTTTIQNMEQEEVILAPAFSNLLSLARMSGDPDEREAVSYVLQVPTDQGLKTHELAQPTIHFELGAHDLAQSRVVLQCKDGTVGVRFEARGSEFDKFYVHVWNPIDCCLMFKTRPLPSGTSMTFEYEAEVVRA